MQKSNGTLGRTLQTKTLTERLRAARVASRDATQGRSAILVARYFR